MKFHAGYGVRACTILIFRQIVQASNSIQYSNVETASGKKNHTFIVHIDCHESLCFKLVIKIMSFSFRILKLNKFGCPSRKVSTKWPVQILLSIIFKFFIILDRIHMFIYLFLGFLDTLYKHNFSCQLMGILCKLIAVWADVKFWDELNN